MFSFITRSLTLYTVVGFHRSGNVWLLVENEKEEKTYSSMTDGVTSQLGLYVKSWIGRTKMRRIFIIFISFVVLGFLSMAYSLFRARGGWNSYSVKLSPSGHMSMIHLLNADGFYEDTIVNVTERNNTLFNKTGHREIWTHPQLDILHSVRSWDSKVII